MDNKTVANIIWKQMNELDRNLVWCMGTTKPTVIEQGLQFKVNGLSFKGLVEVVLDPSDTYNVTFINMKRKLDKEKTELYGKKKYKMERVVVGEYKDVHNIDLMPLLEDVVENKEKK